MKECIKCKDIKNFSYFYKYKNGKPFNQCKNCFMLSQKDNQRRYSKGEKHKLCVKKYQEKHKKIIYKNNAIYAKGYIKNIRVETLKVLGGKCVICGFNDFRALQVDHINGGGCKEKKNKTYKGNYHINVIRSFNAKENKYQLLCANCNWIKRYKNNETRKPNK